MSRADHYRLTISEHQAHVLMRALDMYFRVGMGQLGEVAEHLVTKKATTIEWCDARDLVHDCLRAARVYAMPELPSQNAYHGIASEKIDDTNRVACDLHDVIRHHLSWERHPEGGWTTNFQKARGLSQEPLATIETVKP